MIKHLIIIFIILSFTGCKISTPPDKNHKHGNSNEYAELFLLADSGDYYKLDIFSPWQGSENIVISYFLAHDISKIPGDIEENRKIELPVKKCVCLSTTHIAMIKAAGSLESVIAVSGTDYVSDPIVRKRIDEGKVKDIGYDSNLNTELITSLDPDVVFVYGIGPESAGYISKLETVQIPAIYICDYLELHPLAKAEWMKLFGVLFNASEKTDTIFSEIRGAYESIRDSIVNSATSRPRVMLGLPYKDSWFISPGNSYISTLINDAGGEYIWAEYTSAESMPLSIESVFREALDSDYWLNIGNITGRDELMAFDKRFKDLPPVLNENLYNNISRLNIKGGNDYWESGAVNPHLVLEDIASILHPEIVQDHVLHYYIKVE